MKLLSKIICLMILITISTPSLAIEKSDKLAEYATNYQILVDVIRNAEQGMALLNPQEFANKERPYMPTKYGTHLGGGFPSLREAYQEHIGNDPTLRALQDVSANADLASAQKAKGQCTLTDFERQLVGISAKVDPFRYDEAQNYQALYNQKMSALSMQEAFIPKANLNTFNPSGNIKLSPNAMKYLTAAQE